jgi:hypothetical protein
MMAQDRTKRHHPGPTGDQQQWPAEILLPYEIAADRPAQLQHVALAQFVDQVQRDLPVRHTFHGELEIRVPRRGGDRVATLRLIAVSGGQPDINVLTCAVPGPSGNIQYDGPGPRGLREPDDNAGLPSQSPA